jgi:hypothetical protein
LTGRDRFSDKRRGEKGDERFIEQLLSDSLHMRVRLDHLGVIVVRSREGDPVLVAERPSSNGRGERLLVAAHDQEQDQKQGIEELEITPREGRGDSRDKRSNVQSDFSGQIVLGIDRSLNDLLGGDGHELLEAHRGVRSVDSREKGFHGGLKRTQASNLSAPVPGKMTTSERGRGQRHTLL